ncbi:MAG: hypothetical protein ACOCX1_06140 [Fimbriimonadaceae bacterium]
MVHGSTNTSNCGEFGGTCFPEDLDVAQGQEQRMAQKDLKVVRLLEPELCLRCRFAKRASVAREDGTMQRMVYCTRLDCDNWDYQSAEEATDVTVDESDSHSAEDDAA